MNHNTLSLTSSRLKTISMLRVSPDFMALLGGAAYRLLPKVEIDVGGAFATLTPGARAARVSLKFKGDGGENVVK